MVNINHTRPVFHNPEELFTIGSVMISAAQKSVGFPATHQAKAYGFVFFFFCSNAKSIRFCDIINIYRP